MSIIHDIGVILGAALDNIPDFEREMLNFCAYKSNYIVCFEGNNSIRYKASDICEAINN